MILDDRETVEFSGICLKYSDWGGVTNHIYKEIENISSFSVARQAYRKFCKLHISSDTEASANMIGRMGQIVVDAVESFKKHVKDHSKASPAFSTRSPCLVSASGPRSDNVVESCRERPL